MLVQDRGTEFTAELELWGDIECTVNRVGDIYLGRPLTPLRAS